MSGNAVVGLSDKSGGLIMDRKNFEKTDVLIVGAGPAGLACAITAKKQYPGMRVCVVDKSPIPGGHNISGAALEQGPIQNLLNMTVKDWRQAPIVHDVLSRTVASDEVYMLSKKGHTRLTSLLNLAADLHLPSGEILSGGDYIVSISKLTRLLACIAKNIGVELLFGLSAEDLVYNGNCAIGVQFADKLTPDAAKSPDYFPSGWAVDADYIVLAEGCDGFVTEKFVNHCGLVRKQPPIFAVGAKEIIEVSAQQYKAFGDSSAVHLPGYPLWQPLRGPSIIGCSKMYSMGGNRIAVVLMTNLSWKYPDFTPQKAFALLKEHPFVSRYIMDGKVMENGAKMLPQGGYYSIPTDPKTSSIGKNNVVLVGDSASFLNPHRQRGIGNAIISGMTAGYALGNIQNKALFAEQYTDMLRSNGLLENLKRYSKYRQIVARLGIDIGLPLSGISRVLPFMRISPDNQVMDKSDYPFEPREAVDRKSFIRHSGAKYNENHKCHIEIKDLDVCKWECMRTYDCPCLQFCPAGVFDRVLEHIQPLNSANCLHCRSCERKCPYNNIYWSLPQATEGPRYQYC